jgi:hypothetical protein
MSFNLTKKFLTFMVSAVILVNPIQGFGQDSKSMGVLDESLEDLSIVLGSGAVGAILGLSTLSFAEVPKDKVQNIAIGGAVGIVFGVGMVIFNQAAKSSSIITEAPTRPLNSDAVESLARIDFAKQKIAENYLLPTTVGYNFKF